MLKVKHIIAVSWMANVTGLFTMGCMIGASSRYRSQYPGSSVHVWQYSVYVNTLSRIAFDNGNHSERSISIAVRSDKIGYGKYLFAS